MEILTTKQLLNNQVIKIFNVVYELTDREVQVLTELLFMNDNILSKQNRHRIIDQLGMHKTHLSTCLTKLKNKGLLINNKGWMVLPTLIPVINDNECTITFTIKITE